MRVKNWKRFQHFRDRCSPPWIKLYRDLLNDPDWHALSGDDARVLVMLWMVAAEGNGELPELKKIAFRLRMEEKPLTQALTRLGHWIEADDITTISSRYQETAREREGERDRDSASAEPKRGRRRKPRTELPDDWRPPLGLDPSEVVRFRNHAKASGRLCADWNAAYRNWLDSPFRAARPVLRPEGIL